MQADYESFIDYRQPIKTTAAKLAAGEAVKVAYFGGSVTSGYGSTSSEAYSWRALVGRYLKSKYPASSITNYNLACGESGTYLGTFRFTRDVVSVNPDLLFLEYSINDRYYGSSYEDSASRFETMVREIRAANPVCDIVCVLVTDVNVARDAAKGILHTQAQAHYDICEKYNISTIRVGCALASMLGENFTDEQWSKYFLDIVHPLNAGYNEYYKCIHEYLANALNPQITGLGTDTNYVLPAQQSAALFDGNRTLIAGQNSTGTTTTLNSLLTASNNAGGSGFTYVNSQYGYMTDYIGYLNLAQNTVGELVFEFDGTDLAFWTNVADTGSYFEVSLDGGNYTKVYFKAHNPTNIIVNCAPGNHTVKVKCGSGIRYGTAGVDSLQICAIMHRDSSKSTKK